MEEIVQVSEDDHNNSENDSSADAEDSSEENEGNPRLADALARVIRMSQKKKSKSIVLSKAKLYSDQISTKKKHDFEIEPDPNAKIKVENTEDVKQEELDVKPGKKALKILAIKKQEKTHRGRLKPSPLNRDKERPLVKIATRGVVQLFNAVKQQQSAINKEINKPGVTESAKEKILKSIDKKSFLDVLKGKSIDSIKLNMETENSMHEEVKEELAEEPSWQVLREDFMMGAKLKDWDKKEIEVEE